MTVLTWNLVDARAAGEGNLEILVQSGSQSLPTEVEAIGGNEAIFGVSFTPLETIVEESQSQLSSIIYLSSSINKKGINHQLHQHGSLGGGGETTAPSSTTTVVQPHLIYVTFNDDNVPGNNHNITRETLMCYVALHSSPKITLIRFLEKSFRYIIRLLEKSTI